MSIHVNSCQFKMKLADFKQKYQSPLEYLLIQQLQAFKMPLPMAEYKFHPKRRFRFDFAWPDHLLAVEIEGGSWIAGRHSRGTGFEADCLKYDEAIRLGWNVYRATSGMVKSGRAIETIKILLGMTNER